MSVPPPPAPGGQPPVGQPDPYGPPPVLPLGYGQAPGQFGGQQSGPYGRPPMQPPVYGQAPGQPANYGLAPGQPYKPKRNKALFIRLGIVLVIVAVAGTFAIIRSLNSPDSSVAGDCLAIAQFDNSTDPDKVACDAPNANMKIGVRVDNGDGACPDGDYDKYSVTGSTSYLLCLMINAKQGDCFAGMSSSTAGYTRVA